MLNICHIFILMIIEESSIWWTNRYKKNNGSISWNVRLYNKQLILLLSIIKYDFNSIHIYHLKKCNNNCHTHTHTHTTFPWCWYQNMNTQKKSNAIYESLNWFKLYSHRQHADADDDDDDDHNPVGYKQSFTYLYIIINVYKFQDFRCNKFILFFRFDA